MGEDDQKQTHAPGWCKIDKMITKHISTLSPKGFWVCTLCGCRCSELKGVPRVRKYV